MTLFKPEKLARRKFIKGIAGAGVGYAWFSLDSSADSEKNSELDGKSKVHLAAACGTYCGACPAYINKHSQYEKRTTFGPPKDNIAYFVGYMNKLLCDGCLSGGTLAGHCQTCRIRLCAANKQSDSRCSGCEELPCYRITDLIKQGNYPHRQQYLPNLKKIREMGAEEWVKYEEKRWLCPRCGLPMSWYDAKCGGCGEPRSEQLFPLIKT